MMNMEKYKTLEIVQKSPDSPVFHLFLNNPSRRNALSTDFFTELSKALSSLDQNSDVGVIVLSGHGDHFCSGIDLNSFYSIAQPQSEEQGRMRAHLLRNIKGLQAAITAVERCRKPVIAEIQGACIGAGIDLVTACDIRYCTEDAFFCVKEIDLAITADLGTLQRLPGIVGYGNAMELALTGRRFSGPEAKDMGLVSRVFSSKDAMEQGVKDVAEGIAMKSPLAVIGTKEVMLRSRDMSVDQGLDYVATWNSAMLPSADLTETLTAKRQRRKPIYAKL